MPHFSNAGRPVLLLLLCLLPAAAQPGAPAPPLERCRALDDRFFDCEFPSQSLHRPARFALQLPAGYSAQRRGWPAILFLHGAGRNHLTLYENRSTRSSLASSRSVVVLPEGRNSWWLDSPSAGRYASLLIELLDYLTPRLQLDPARRRRACAGWSMGGYGSIRLAQQHPASFQAWAGIIALLDFPNPGAYPPEFNHSVPPVFGPPESWPLLNPLQALPRLQGMALRFVTAETAFDRRMNETFHQALSARAIPHSFSIVPGAHRFDVVARELPATLQWLDSQIAKGFRP